MIRRAMRRGWLSIAHSLAIASVLAALSSCGGGSGNATDSGTNKTYLSVEAIDSNGDSLQYQWRVTAGTIENRNSPQTVWTMPDGPGLHFAYVTVSDGKGGYVVQQYVVGTDAIATQPPPATPITYSARQVSDFEGSAYRLRFASADATRFTPSTGGTPASRIVYLADVRVQVTERSSGAVMFIGQTDLGGEVNLPKLRSGALYDVRCATSRDAPLVLCDAFNAGSTAGVRQTSAAAALDAGRNLRLYGHVALADGGVCGMEDEFFGTQSAATVQLLATDGSELGAPVHVNRYGDYGIDAAVGVDASLRVRVQCEGYSRELAVPRSSDPVGYVSTAPVELSHEIANTRPQLRKMVAIGPDGNVRGKMFAIEGPGGQSLGLPGSRQFLAYKGSDTRLSACMYYRSLGAAQDCDAQGNMVGAISFDDWRRAKGFAPYGRGASEVAANYINRMDLNLVRRMVAIQSAPDDIAFYVCNSPGPDGTTQLEVDQLMAAALSDLQRVACVAMEWSVSPGVNEGKPFTKFLTFGPSGSLLRSINLDGRGEKYMPGACVACHGGLQYNGRFPDHGNPSPLLGSGFLPFDTGNYAFSTVAASLSEQQQSAAFHALNQLTRATEPSDLSVLSTLVKGWYAGGSDTLDKNYVPPAWKAVDTATGTSDASRFYKQVVGASCRTCHVSLAPTYDWNSIVLDPGRAQTHFCGGQADVALNAAMPNALISRDRIAERAQADPSLAALMTRFLGCSTPLPDPVYPKR